MHKILERYSDGRIKYFGFHTKSKIIMFRRDAPAEYENLQNKWIFSYDRSYIDKKKKERMIACDAVVIREIPRLVKERILRKVCIL
jgi:hypothetical protein